MKRYSPLCYGSDSCGIDELDDPYGKYVHYADVVALIHDIEDLIIVASPTEDTSAGLAARLLEGIHALSTAQPRP
jgi:hypothetical protein